MRLLRNDDLVDLVALAGNWEVARWLATMPHPYTEADGREWIARVRQDQVTGHPRRFAIALKESDGLIGGVGLDGSTGDGSEEPALGYWLGEPHWGNGYAREAVAAVIDYGLRTLGLETYCPEGLTGLERRTPVPSSLYCSNVTVQSAERASQIWPGFPKQPPLSSILIRIDCSPSPTVALWLHPFQNPLIHVGKALADLGLG
jgi:hypothetical protein